ncbi:thiosulfate oxidation carrier complex protein SoxZ [Pelomonas sp. SE-A7]|uniref:thiosulfate oxidation carrier complex protein SoxZ n=1 Tax=Pelomonas sp. SE-A7 TaxID=3054953 RepID=UPI00259C79C3|nr:thiosulfate oxidation carrier complex protein SoxZ [Pelomonas sp. SE-A7]MDM4767816.1 thiosulfate oxidation carrier complex protein SoxZ [Pelomonas sp. SE-A7]
MARALITLPPEPPRAGEAFEVRCLIAHAMETGFRRGDEGALLARNILRRFECRLDGELLFAADLHPAVSANPYLAFWLQIQRGGELSFEWRGDQGFQHRETRRLQLR